MRGSTEEYQSSAGIIGASRAPYCAYQTYVVCVCMWQLRTEICVANRISCYNHGKSELYLYLDLYALLFSPYDGKHLNGIFGILRARQPAVLRSSKLVPRDYSKSICESSGNHVHACILKGVYYLLYLVIIWFEWSQRFSILQT